MSAGDKEMLYQLSCMPISDSPEPGYEGMIRGYVQSWIQVWGDDVSADMVIEGLHNVARAANVMAQRIEERAEQEALRRIRERRQAKAFSRKM